MKTNEIYQKEIAKANGKATQEDHYNAMWTALVEGDDSDKSSKDDGEGTIWVYTFHNEKDKPKFNCISDDIFNQIEIN